MGRLNPPKRASVWAKILENVKGSFLNRPISDLVYARIERESETQVKNGEHYGLIGHKIESGGVFKAPLLSLRSGDFFVVFAPFLNLPIFIDSRAAPQIRHW